jgi:hypothetical protein
MSSFAKGMVRLTMHAAIWTGLIWCLFSVLLQNKKQEVKARDVDFLILVKAAQQAAGK